MFRADETNFRDLKTTPRARGFAADRGGFPRGAPSGHTFKERAPLHLSCKSLTANRVRGRKSAVLLAQKLYKRGSRNLFRADETNFRDLKTTPRARGFAADRGGFPRGAPSGHTFKERAPLHLSCKSLTANRVRGRKSAVLLAQKLYKRGSRNLFRADETNFRDLKTTPRARGFAADRGGFPRGTPSGHTFKKERAPLHLSCKSLAANRVRGRKSGFYEQ